MWDLVGNPEDRFSHNEAHLLIQLFSILVSRTGFGFWLYQFLAIVYFLLLNSMSNQILFYEKANRNQNHTVT